MTNLMALKWITERVKVPCNARTQTQAAAAVDRTALKHTHCELVCAGQVNPGV